MSDVIMNENQQKAVSRLWDALSDILEEPHLKLPSDLRKKALKAIDRAREAFSEEVHYSD